MNSIRLVACIDLSYSEDLLVEDGQLTETLEGYTSHDQMVGPVKDLLERHRLPWSEVFVSLFVLFPGDDTTWLHDAFGYPFELDVDKVISDVTLVCSNDVQNWIDSATSPKVYADLTEMESPAKIEVLREARAKADNGRAEARMGRALQIDDVLRRRSS